MPTSAQDFRSLSVRTATITKLRRLRAQVEAEIGGTVDTSELLEALMDSANGPGLTARFRREQVSA